MAPRSRLALAALALAAAALLVAPTAAQESPSETPSTTGTTTDTQTPSGTPSAQGTPSQTSGLSPSPSSAATPTATESTLLKGVRPLTPAQSGGAYFGAATGIVGMLLVFAAAWRKMPGPRDGLVLPGSASAVQDAFPMPAGSSSSSGGGGDGGGGDGATAGQLPPAPPTRTITAGIATVSTTKVTNPLQALHVGVTGGNHHQTRAQGWGGVAPDTPPVVGR